MSKIYEALLRAEQDRIATEGKDPVHSTDGSTVEGATEQTPLAADGSTNFFPSTPTARPASPTPRPSASVIATPYSSASAPFIDTFRDSWPQPESPAIASIADAQAELLAMGDRRIGDRRIGPSDTPVVEERRLGDRRLGDFDLNDVPRYAWKPSLEHLPALGERGNSVEQFRSLRSRMHEFRDLNTLKSLLVSSGLPQEGKSFIAANVAISFARHKASRVLLIDGDMRRSSLHHLLGCNSEPGLSEYLAGKATMTEIMQRAKPSESGGFLHHGLASLTFIGAGKDSNTAADLSGNYRFDELIKKLSPFFDWIVVDSSPVNLVADGVNLSRACDGVLLVARAGVTKFETAQRALTELKASNILGFVLNAVPDPPKTGGYYGYGGYDSYDAHRDSGDGGNASNEVQNNFGEDPGPLEAPVDPAEIPFDAHAT